MVASDLLDDLQDDEANAISRLEGNARTLNASTGLLLLALAELLRAPFDAAAAGLLVDASLRACSGQDADLRLQASKIEDLEDALAITESKSGSLVAVACRLGALAGGADARAQARFAQFGRYVGIVTQLANDIAALDPAATNKTDIALSRPILPLVFAARHCQAPAGNAGLRRAGAVPFGWAVAETYRRHALDLIPGLTTNPPGREVLARLVRPL
jgi:geranylgeranyl diphosphate synthase type I